MGRVSAAILPLAALLGVVVAATQPMGRKSVVLIVAVLALAGVALLAAGVLSARRR